MNDQAVSGSLTHNAEDNNGKFDRAMLERELANYGRAFGAGQNSRPSAFLRAVEAAYKLADVGPKDAEALYSKFQQGCAARQGLEYKAEASAKVQVSKFKRALMLGALPGIDGVDVMNRGCDIIKDMAAQAESPLKGSAYDNMVSLARAQIAQPKQELTDDEIRALLSKDSPDKTVLDHVIEAYKKSYKLCDELVKEGIDPGFTVKATEELAAQIMAMGGDLPPMTKDEKKVATARQTLSALGYAVEAKIEAPDAGSEKAAA